ncbi:hypothetical protein Q8791_29030 [Nocardiopsis sp. CT-R113]|uniref:Head fiber protein n=1 Tax=Nocardiopsis codii TaxID=3065942 RepID=A0ABU7KGB4_9ACTN|nr:hypothetical protein [Nocardiopsis sp. CT-R113]MEE2041276.1 hypothetical protein [Nocardiopsis sp. CT-R113]
MGFLHYRDASGALVEVGPGSPLPTTASGAGGGGVATVNGVTPDESGDVALDAPAVGAAQAAHTHDAADITTGALAVARVPNLAASKITSGVLAAARLPAAAAVPDATDDPAATVNALLASLRTAGYLAP